MVAPPSSRDRRQRPLRCVAGRGSVDDAAGPHGHGVGLAHHKTPSSGGTLIAQSTKTTPLRMTATMTERPAYVAQADVAATAGVSQTTVSRHLGGRHIGPGLALRVRDAITELGYQRNPRIGRPTATKPPPEGGGPEPTETT